jgi:hypothetical protein
MTPEFQDGIPYEQRRKFEVLNYSNGRLIVKNLQTPPVGMPLRSNMLDVMAQRYYKRSYFKADEISLRRFCLLNMNDDWIIWEREYLARRKGERNRNRIQIAKLLTGLPPVRAS